MFKNFLIIKYTTFLSVLHLPETGDKDVVSSVVSSNSKVLAETPLFSTVPTTVTNVPYENSTSVVVSTIYVVSVAAPSAVVSTRYVVSVAAPSVVVSTRYVVSVVIPSVVVTARCVVSSVVMRSVVVSTIYVVSFVLGLEGVCIAVLLAIVLCCELVLISVEIVVSMSRIVWSLPRVVCVGVAG